MCGIFGVISESKINQEIFSDSLLLQKHRGPDNQSCTFIEESIGLGHVRLSILDLDKRSNQPFEYKDLSLIFNGEIFNYLELKSELEEQGYHFNTSSDTEVLVKSYDFWGEKCVERFNGMWAFMIYSKDKDEVFVSRDRYGIKPLNYSFKNNELIVSSEIKSILKYDPGFNKANTNSIVEYLKESIGAQSEETWFLGVKRLKPGHNLKMSLKDRRLNIFKYYDYPQQSSLLSFSDAKRTYFNLLKDAIEIRMRSDVPVGITLSGGLDSSSIAEMAQKHTERMIESFTASFPGEPYDEMPIVEDFLKNRKINANKVLTNYDTYLKDLNKLIYHLESGHSSPAIIPLQSIMTEARQKVRVLLEGQGADELLAGYVNTYFIRYCLELVAKFKLRTLAKELKVLDSKNLLNFILIHFRINGNSFTRHLMRKIYGIEGVILKPDGVSKKKRNRKKNLNNDLLEQHKGGLVNLLHYGDAVSMMYSLESRLPFMDYRLVDFIFQLPFEYKYKFGKGKLIHREAFSDLLPEEIIKNRTKIGFVSPIVEIIKSKEIEDILSSNLFYSRGLVHKERFKILFAKHKSGDRDYSRFLFRVLCVELWYRTFIDQ